MKATSKTTTGLSAAIAAAALFLTAPMAQAGSGHAAASGTATMGHCMGANACKGQGFKKLAAGKCLTDGGKIAV